MNIQVIIRPDSLELSDYNKRRLHDVSIQNGGSCRGHIVFNMPESSKERRFFHGALIRLWVYLDGSDWKDSTTCNRYFEIFMLENFPEVQKINGKIHTFGKSSKGAKMLNACTERLVDYLCDSYGFRHDSPVFATANFKKWRDELMSYSNEDYIEYLVRTKVIDKDKMI